MEPLVEEVLGYEIAMQCRFILRGAEQLDEALRHWPEREPLVEELQSPISDERRHELLTRLLDPESEILTGAWFAIQGILVSAANVSKLLFGTEGKKAAERANVARKLGVTESSPLAVASLRNDFEHFDERLERWAKKRHPGESIVGRNIWHDAEGAHPIIPGEPSNRRFGHFDPDTREVSFWGHSLNLTDLVTEAQRVLDLIRNGGPFEIE